MLQSGPSISHVIQRQLSYEQQLKVGWTGVITHNLANAIYKICLRKLDWYIYDIYIFFCLFIHHSSDFVNLTFLSNWQSLLVDAFEDESQMSSFLKGALHWFLKILLLVPGSAYQSVEPVVLNEKTLSARPIAWPTRSFILATAALVLIIQFHAAVVKINIDEISILLDTIAWSFCSQVSLLPLFFLPACCVSSHTHLSSVLDVEESDSRCKVMDNLSFCLLSHYVSVSWQ